MLLFNPKVAPIFNSGMRPGVSMNYGEGRHWRSHEAASHLLCISDPCRCLSVQVWVFVFFIATFSSCLSPQGWQSRVKTFPPTRNSSSTAIMKSHEKRKLKPAPLQPHPGQRSNKMQGRERGWCSPPPHVAETNPTQQASTHIMRKVPPQSDVPERAEGFALGVRPRGPRTRPRKLHTTTRRTTLHTATQTPHLKEAWTHVDLGLCLPLITRVGPLEIFT